VTVEVRGYSCQLSPSWPWQTDNPCARSTWNNGFVSYLYLGPNNIIQTGSTGLYMGLNAKGVSIRWNPNEIVQTSLPSSTSPSTSHISEVAISGTVSTSPTSPLSLSTSALSLSSSSSDTHHNISAGVIAGAIGGAIAGAILLSTLIYLILLIRRKRRAVIHMLEAGDVQSYLASSELDTSPVYEIGVGKPEYEKGRDAVNLQELPADHK
jgi:hypothetical protein